MKIRPFAAGLVMAGLLVCSTGAVGAATKTTATKTTSKTTSKPVPKPTAGSTGKFCAAAKRYLAVPLDLPAVLDMAWVKTVTEPVFAMARYAPANLKRHALVVAVASYQLRADAVKAVNAMAVQDVSTFANQLGVLIPKDIPAVASFQYEGSFQILTHGVAKVCHFDMPGEVERIIRQAQAG
jgi:hypothetical protein